MQSEPHISRKTFLSLMAAGMPALAWAVPGPKEDITVRDHLWVWAHDTKAYHGPGWGLPGNSALTPVEGARHLDVPNIIFIRYQDNPAPPFDAYYEPFKSMKRVVWSIAGAGGATSDDERDHVFRLAAANPNIVGVFMDDFFQFTATGKPQWLAENGVQFPVTLTLTLPAAKMADAVELVQSEWDTGDYRSRDVVVDITVDGKQWTQAGLGRMPNQPGAPLRINIRKTTIKALRLRILGTHDTKAALSCGLSRLRLMLGGHEVPLSAAKAEASSTYPGQDPSNVLADAPTSPAAASLSVEQLKTVRKRLEDVGGRKLDLGVTLYMHQLDPRIVSHLNLCDVVSLWTWKAEDIKDLEANFERFNKLAPSKRILLGCYMWDFGTNKPMPVELMRQQCTLGLQWLKQGRIEGIIFLATNICDLGLETVQWTRDWIALVGEDRISPA